MQPKEDISLAHQSEPIGLFGGHRIFGTRGRPQSILAAYCMLGDLP